MQDFEHLWHRTIESEYLVLSTLGKHPGRSYELLDYLRCAVESVAAKRGVPCAAEDFDRAATTERPLASVVRSYLRSIADLAVASGATDLNLRDRPGLVVNAELTAEQHASSALDCIIAASLKRWFSERDEMMESRAVGWPACWGGQFGVAEFGGYVSEDAFFEVLPTEHERNLYYCCCDCYSDEDWIEVAENVRDDAWLEHTASLLKLSEPKESFDKSPQHAQDRGVYGTCESWISNMERMGVFEMVSEGSAKAASHTPCAVVASASRAAASVVGEPASVFGQRISTRTSRV